MRRIVAIGGGEIGMPGYPVETTTIDKQIINLTGKSAPRVLFIPTASGDAPGYCEAFRDHFGGRLGCKTDVLSLIERKPSEVQIREAILGSDAVYVGGGNTARMLRIWRRMGVHLVLQEACERGIVLSGLSAGAICWFRYGSSDSRKFSNPDAGLMRVTGLGFVSVSLCPHYDAEADRKPDLRKMMRQTPGIAIALDNCSAIEVVGESYRILASRTGANAYRVYWSSGICREEFLPRNGDYQPLPELLRKGPLRTSG